PSVRVGEYRRLLPDGTAHEPDDGRGVSGYHCRNCRARSGHGHAHVLRGPNRSAGRRFRPVLGIGSLSQFVILLTRDTGGTLSVSGARGRRARGTRSGAQFERREVAQPPARPGPATNRDGLNPWVWNRVVARPIRGWWGVVGPKTRYCSCPAIGWPGNRAHRRRVPIV